MRKKIVPDWEYTPGRLRAYIEDETADIEPCGCGQPGWEVPYGKLNEKLRRYRLPEHLSVTVDDCLVGVKDYWRTDCTCSCA